MISRISEKHVNKRGKEKSRKKKKQKCSTSSNVTNVLENQEDVPNTNEVQDEEQIDLNDTPISMIGRYKSMLFRSTELK